MGAHNSPIYGLNSQDGCPGAFLTQLKKMARGEQLIADMDLNPINLVELKELILGLKMT
jgi:hypothetical protein